MKKIFSIILTFTIIMSFNLITPAFASSKTPTETSITSNNSTNEKNLDIQQKDSGIMHPDGSGIPNIFLIQGKFTGTNTFTITCKNIGVDTIDNVQYVITAYDSRGRKIGGTSTDVGSLSPLGEIPESYYYINVSKVVVVYTLEDSDGITGGTATLTR